MITLGKFPSEHDHLGGGPYHAPPENLELILEALKCYF